jgi:hypothetical protein
VALPLHVANGHCSTRLIEAAGLPGRTSIWADPLHDGPVPAGVPDDELLRVRARFLTPEFGLVSDVEADLAGWRAVVDHHDAYDELVLWFEHDLFDQLNLIQLLTRVGVERPTPKPVSLVSFDSYPGHPKFKGLGELTPGDIARLFEKRQRVRPEQFATAAKAWNAFRGTDAARIRALLDEDTSALPFLAPALARYLEELPSPADGLTRSERRLLAQLAGGPLDIHAAFAGMYEHEHWYHITDTSFRDLIKSLAERSPALITVHAAQDASHTLPQGTLSLAS